MRRQQAIRRRNMMLRRVRAVVLAGGIFPGVRGCTPKTTQRIINTDVIRAEAVVQHSVVEPIQYTAKTTVVEEETMKYEAGHYTIDENTDPVIILAAIGHTEAGIEHMMAVYKLSYEEAYDSLVNTLAVIVNRANHPTRYPDTIYGVVFEGNGRQFNGIRSKDFGDVTESELEAAQDALNGNVAIAEDVLWYHNAAMSTDTKHINSMKKEWVVAQYGPHEFFNRDH